jgi:hypothetical protein
MRIPVQKTILTGIAACVALSMYSGTALAQCYGPSGPVPCFAPRVTPTPPSSAPPTRTVRVCIGDALPAGQGCPRAPAGMQAHNFDCGFAAQHPSDTDAAAALRVCGSTNYRRLASFGGHKCGYIILDVICSAYVAPPREPEEYIPGPYNPYLPSLDDPRQPCYPRCRY